MQALKLLELPEPIQDSIDAGRVAPSIGYEIAKVADPGRQLELAGKDARGEAGRAEVRDLTVGAPRPKRWSCTLDDGTRVTATTPGREGDAASAVEKPRAALKRARAEVARSRDMLLNRATSTKASDLLAFIQSTRHPPHTRRGVEPRRRGPDLDTAGNAILPSTRGSVTGRRSRSRGFGLNQPVHLHFLAVPRSLVGSPRVTPAG